MPDPASSHPQDPSAAAAQRLRDPLPEGAPLSLTDLVKEAADLCQQGELGRAAALSEAVLEVEPAHLPALVQRGIIAGRLGDPGKAIEFFDRALGVDPLNPVILNNKGMALHDLGRHQEALALLDLAIETRPDYAIAFSNRGNALRALGRPAEALASYERAIAIRGDFAQAHYNRGSVLYGLAQFPAALDSFDRAIAARGGYAEAFCGRAAACCALKQWGPALVAAESALAIKPAYVEALVNRGIALSRLGWQEKALESFDLAVRLRPDYAEAYFNRGNALFESDTQAALGCFRRTLELNPDFLHAYERLGALLTQLGETAEAVIVYRNWLARAPADPIAQHLYAAASCEQVPSRASDQYVSRHFDEFADTFDATLESLGYAAPRLLFDALMRRTGSRKGLSILDAGCGTGLCGLLLREVAGTLAGVDLSAQMLAKAAARNLYDELHRDELCAFMASRPQAFDAVICADTLVYFGALEDAAAAAYRCLRPLGIFAFTVEALTAESESFRIRGHGRYAHSRQYLEDTLGASGFSSVDCQPVLLRKEAGKDVAGYLVSAARMDEGDQRLPGVDAGVPAHAVPADQVDHGHLQ